MAMLVSYTQLVALPILILFLLLVNSAKVDPTTDKSTDPPKAAASSGKEGCSSSSYGINSLRSLTQPELTSKDVESMHKKLADNSDSSGSSSSDSKDKTSNKKPPVQLLISRNYAAIHDYFYVQNTGFEVLFQFEEILKNSQMTVENSRWGTKNNAYVLEFGVFLWSSSESEEEQEVGDDDDKEDNSKESDEKSGNIIGGSQHLLGEAKSSLTDQRFPAELQLVHFRKSDKSLDKAKNVNDGILVTCILFEISTEDNPVLDPLLHGFRTAATNPTSKPKVVHGPFSLDGLYPLGALSYYEYNAPTQFTSIAPTTCGITAKYIVFEETTIIGAKQFESLVNIVNADGIKFGIHWNKMNKINSIKNFKYYPHFENELAYKKLDELHDHMEDENEQGNSNSDTNDDSSGTGTSSSWVKISVVSLGITTILQLVVVIFVL